jgi:N6-L-threonylcarbamoyladenine synthase
MLVDESIKFPFLLLLVSGGHCQIIEAKGIGDYNILGSTLDDAVGEAFDKVARMMGLLNPGGPEVEKRARLGDENAYQFPSPLIDRNDCNFSFSGLKTAVKRKIDSFIELNDDKINNVCASFQRTVAEILARKVQIGVSSTNVESRNIIIAGGVAANNYIREYLAKSLPEYNISSPPLWLCTDNAAMIAWVGLQKLKLGQVDELNFEPKSRWSLTEANKIIV